MNCLLRQKCVAASGFFNRRYAACMQAMQGIHEVEEMFANDSVESSVGGIVSLGPTFAYTYIYIYIYVCV